MLAAGILRALRESRLEAIGVSPLICILRSAGPMSCLGLSCTGCRLASHVMLRSCAKQGVPSLDEVEAEASMCPGCWCSQPVAAPRILADFFLTFAYMV